MVDFDLLEGFEWDDGNTRKSSQKHGVTPGESEQIFTNQPLIVADDATHSAEESRFNALGKTSANRLLHVTFTVRKKFIRVISARDMNRKERKIYAQGAQENS